MSSVDIGLFIFVALVFLAGAALIIKVAIIDEKKPRK